MELLEAYRRGLREFTDRVGQVDPAQWSAPTPCREWDVRALVNHVVGVDRQTAPVLAGETAADIGHEDGQGQDLLGPDPVRAAEEAAAAADGAVSSADVLDRTVRGPAGEIPAEEYLHQMLAEHLIHGWDLAVAIGVDPGLDPAVVHECADWFTSRVANYQAGQLIRTGIDVPAGADEQDRLLAAFGRDPDWAPDS
ncbi:TIGR03086 family metal-binding protein [Micromonosporaceae bacterium DT194]|uniref:TIGR03086 family metal-binding protein n=1 Tax=Melissospora conviva TaxID=3388432 RepID=UPI003C190D4F